jgi:hypothetical protein
MSLPAADQFDDSGGKTVDQHDRHEEAFATEETRYDQELDEEERRRHEAAERLKNDPLQSSGE